MLKIESMARVCPACGLPFGSERATQAKFCSRSCKDRFSGRVRRGRNRDKIAAQNKEYKATHRLQSLVYDAKKRAKKRGLEFRLSANDLHIPEVCPVLGIRLSHGEGVLHPGSPSIDRIDNTKGYVPENVRIISHRANSLKNSASPEECRLIYEDSIQFATAA